MQRRDFLISGVLGSGLLTNIESKFDGIDDINDNIFKVGKEHGDGIASFTYGDGLIYTGGRRWDDGEGRIFVYDAENGDYISEYQGHSNRNHGYTEVEDGILYVGETSTFDDVIAYDTNNDFEILWENTEHEQSITSLYVEDGIAYSGNGGASNFYATEVIAYDGEKKFSYDNHSGNVRTIDKENNILYSGGGDNFDGITFTEGHIFAFDTKSEEILWEKTTSNPVQSVKVNDNMMYFSTSYAINQDDYMLHKYDIENNEMIWEYDDFDYDWGTISDIDVKNNLVSFTLANDLIMFDTDSMDVLFKKEDFGYGDYYITEDVLYYTGDDDLVHAYGIKEMKMKYNEEKLSTNYIVGTEDGSINVDN